MNQIFKVFKKFKIFIFIFFLSFSCLSKDVEIIFDQIGTGDGFSEHFFVSVHYIGKFEDGTEFDNSYKKGNPLVFQVGLRQVIPGWEIGINGMKKGGKRIIFIPSTLAYGNKGIGNIIPPNSNLIFEIEIVDIKPPNYKKISPEALFLSNRNEYIVIDIRTNEEWNKTGVIKDSYKITAFDSSGNFNYNFINEFESLVKANSKVVFVSEKGDISSILANGFVNKLGYKNIFSLDGGILNWIDKIYQKSKINFKHHQL